VAEKKWVTVLFPFAFSTILLGFMLTKHFTIKGFLYLREGESSQHFFSTQPYLRIRISNENISVDKEYELWFSPVEKPFAKKLKIDKTPVSLRVKSHIINPVKDLVGDTEGTPVMEIVAFKSYFSKSVFLEKGETDSCSAIYFGFESDIKGNVPWIQLERRDREIRVFSNRHITRKKIGSEKKESFKPFVSNRFDNSFVYTIDSVSFTLRRYIPKGRIQASSSEASLYAGDKISEALNVTVEIGSYRRSVSLFAGEGIGGKPKVIQSDGIKIGLRFGPKPYHLPFSLRLADFRVERYKDSEEPSQFKSDVLIEDSESGIEKPYSIYMNHILKYRGYRIYQYSFDRDEKGSVFFVSRDPGTPVTYTGFFLLIITIAFGFFYPKSRIRELETQLRESQ